jgi:predicted enzyme related to lactoylglutathione lyase
VPKNLIQHFEWTTRNPQRLKAFFGRIFDWTFSEPMPGYTLIEGVGGIFEAPDPQMPIAVTPYVNVKDLSETEAKIAAAGGRIHKSKQEVPGMGAFTIFSDPDGNLVALWEAKRPAPKRARRPAKKKKPAKKRSRR